MGYYIYSSGVKSKKVIEAFGSKDNELLEKLLKNDFYKHYFKKKYSKDVVAKPLKDIIEGNPLDPKIAHDYGYALICLCFTLGESIPFSDDIKFGFETEYIDRLLEENFDIKNFKIDEKLFQNMDVFPIPEIEEWPMIGLLNEKDLKDIKKQLSSIIITDELIENFKNSEDEDEEEKGYACEHLKGILENIDFCLEKGLELVSFCH